MILVVLFYAINTLIWIVVWVVMELGELLVYRKLFYAIIIM